MGAFEALRLVRIRQPEYPYKDFQGVADIVRQVEADGAAHDFDGARNLDVVVSADAPPADALSFYRACIEASIIGHRPLWVRTIPLGRRKFVQKLERDEAQCFMSAGLLEDPPSSEVITWWDRIAAQTRMLTDESKLMQAREAEKRSLAYEATRIASLGIERGPVWMSIEDNTAGYDILSYDRGAEGPVARLLEVKSTIASPLRFFVSRNEWETCQKMAAAYHFHIWDMKNGTLFERTASDVAPHIPQDQGIGRWTSVEIKISSNS